MKKCVECGIDKHERDFHWAIKGLRRKTACKDCTNTKQRTRSKKKYENEREKERRVLSQESELFNPLVTKLWGKSHD